MRVDIIDISLIVLLFQFLTLVPFLLFQKGQNKANKFLALFLLAKVFCISNFLAFRMKETFLVYFPHLFYFGGSFTILWGPLLYFYTKSLSYKDFRLQKRDVVHFLPFAIHFIFYTFLFHLHNADAKRAIISQGGLLNPELNSIISGLINVIILCYTIASFRALWRYRYQLKTEFSNLDSIKLSWMTFVLSGFTVKWLFDVWYLTEYYVTKTLPIVPLAISRIILFLFINIMIFKGLRQPSIFSGVESDYREKKLSLSKDKTEKYARELKSYMEVHKPYLDPEITLVQLASQVGIPHRSLSEVIHQSFGQNFYDFINEHRIKESKRLLSNRSVTVLEILYEVGYNSKSSFNTAFKKYVGMTPSQYKHSSTLQNISSV
ncbi:helix-turn-helix transcriptional regulator [candidate division KSB1 bacterium]|nr:helix-turn-helix transcriptional regulator [candidate division KSB1 bacterium]